MEITDTSLPPEAEPFSADFIARQMKNQVPVNRIVVLDTVYHQAGTDPPITAESKFSRVLASDEQPYVRRAKIGTEWAPLDTGWIKEVGLFLLVNEEGRRFMINPTDEEKKAVADKVIEVGLAGMEAFCVVHPGESLRLSPTDASVLRFRSRSEGTRFTLSVFPA